MLIRSSTALRNDYGEISKLAHTEQEPIYIIKNGDGDLVVMSIDAFERLAETYRLRAKLAVAETVRLTGQGISLAEAKKRIENIINEKG